MIDRDQSVLLTLKTVKKWREEYFISCFDEMLYLRERSIFFEIHPKFIPLYHQAFNEICAQHVLRYFQSDNSCDLEAREHILNDSVAMQWSNFGLYSRIMGEAKDHDHIDVGQFSQIMAILLDPIFEQSNSMIGIFGGREYINIDTHSVAETVNKTQKRGVA